MDQGNLDDAEIWIKCGMETLVHTDHWFYMATTRLHLAALHLRKQEYDNTLREIKKAEKAFIDHGGESANARRLAQIEAMKSLAYLRQNDQDNAQRHRSRCEELLDRLDNDSASYLREQPEFKEILE
jgi:hypothetical protein